MRYAGWYARRRGLLEHLDEGTISLLDCAVHDFLCLIADHETGVAWASAEKIHALCPADISLRAIQRSLAHMEKIGWLKRFRTHGKRGNYPIIIGKYFVSDLSLRWKAVSLERTSDWRNVQFDPVTDPSFVGEMRCQSSVTDPDTELSPVQEVRSENGEGLRPATSATATCGDVLLQGLKNKIREKDEIADEFIACLREENPAALKEIFLAVKATGWSFTKGDETVGAEFLITVSDEVSIRAEKLENRELSLALLCTKIIDRCMKNGTMFPPSFLAYRDELRKSETAKAQSAGC